MGIEKNRTSTRTPERGVSPAAGLQYDCVSSSSPSITLSVAEQWKKTKLQTHKVVE